MRKKDSLEEYAVRAVVEPERGSGVGERRFNDEVKVGDELCV